MVRSRALKKRARGKNHINLNKRIFMNTFSNAQCLKISQNVAFKVLNLGIFHLIFVLLKLTCLVTLFDHKLQVFRNSLKSLVTLNETFSVTFKHYA